MKSGIYLIKNIISNKEYIGRSKNLQVRKHEHWNKLRKGIHKNPHLQASHNKYGKYSLYFVVLEYCEPKDLKVREQWWIDLLDTTDRKKGYNLKGSNGFDSHSLESKLKMSKSKKGNTNRLGKTHTDSAKSKIAAARVGKTQSPESNIKRAKKMKGVGAKVWNLTNPEGISIVVENLKQFCYENKLNDSHMVQVSKGKRPHHRRWKVDRL